MSASFSWQYWIEAFCVASMSATSYVSTNLDNLVVISAYGARPGYRPFFVKLTFVAVCLMVLSVSYALAKAADALPAYDLRYLGLIPMALGAYQIVGLVMRRGADDDETTEAEAKAAIGFSAYFGFALVLLANSSDSVSVMTPLFADLKSAFVLECFATAVVAAILMGSLAGALGRHPLARVYLEAFAKWILPFVLIAIGALIFVEAPSDIFVG
ncbi:cadmium resistance transporter [Methylocapsa palsarum]|uniref:Cadmium resistance protein CadD, predicted permease n=1 Tax=Methylocapsa palsarum TaxID=1612308 RepID=A0A1I3XKK3_9HYPH|nr:cadmium resistance transporter [Methylocapsa palsarum]SFK19571.1 Cadmium resistance protein CadD, predicted permease [Methylocapsa palsarum]